MSRFEVDAAQVEAASGTVRSAGAAVTTEVDRMMRILNDLQNTWRGTASSQFAQCAAEWRATQDQVHQALDHISVALNNAATNYTETEQANTRMFA